MAAAEDAPANTSVVSPAAADPVPAPVALIMTAGAPPPALFATPVEDVRVPKGV